MPILYPIFIICANLCIDNFWRKIFDDLSQGICHSDVILSPKTLSYKTQVICYNDYTPFELHKKIYELFSQELNYNNTCADSYKWKESEWKNIRKHKLKDMLIINYIIELGKSHNFSLKTKKTILSNIKLAFIYGDIEDSDLEYADGKIININNLNLETFLISNKNITKNQSGEKNNTLSHKWKRYLQKLHKDVLNIDHEIRDYDEECIYV